MSKVISTTVLNPNGKEDTCAYAVIDSKELYYLLSPITVTDRYTISFYIKALANESLKLWYGEDYKEFSVTTSWQKIEWSFNAEHIDNVMLQFTQGNYYIYNTMLERGDVATDYRLSQADQDKILANVEETLNAKYAQLVIALDNITLEVSETNGRVDKTEAKIEVMSNNIVLKVDKNGVINAINVSDEGVKISAEKIELEGAVTFSSLSDEVVDSIEKSEKTANSALSYSQTATNTAATASAKANSANDTASASLETANEAKNTANGADTKAGAALSAANSAYNTATSVDEILAQWAVDNNKTLIDGGKIYTDTLFSKDIKMTGTFEATNQGYVAPNDEDLLKMRNYILGTVELTDLEKKYFDLNNSGNVEMKDVLALRKIQLGEDEYENTANADKSDIQIIIKPSDGQKLIKMIAQTPWGATREYYLGLNGVKVPRLHADGVVGGIVQTTSGADLDVLTNAVNNLKVQEDGEYLEKISGNSYIDAFDMYRMGQMVFARVRIVTTASTPSGSTVFSGRLSNSPNFPIMETTGASYSSGATVGMFIEPSGAVTIKVSGGTSLPSGATCNISACWMTSET